MSAVDYSVQGCHKTYPSCQLVSILLCNTPAMISVIENYNYLILFKLYYGFQWVKVSPQYFVLLKVKIKEKLIKKTNGV